MDLETPPDLGYLTPAEMLGVEADRAAGLLEINNDAWDVPKAPVNSRPEGREPVQVWFSNTDRYFDVLRRVPYNRFVHAANRTEKAWRTNPFDTLDEILPPGYDFQVLVISQTAGLLYDRRASHPSVNGGVLTPIEHLPVWKYGDDPEELIRMCRAFARRKWSRIIVGYLPREDTRTTQVEQTRIKNERLRTLSWLHKVGVAFPEVMLHFHDGREYRHMFGLAWAAVDLDPANYTKGKWITLPSGAKAHTDKARRALRWLHVLGFSLSDVQTGPDRVIFNMTSATWAAENFCSRQALAFTRQGKRDDPYGLFPAARALRDYRNRKGKLNGAQQVVARAGEHPEKAHWRMRPLELTPDYLPQFGPDPAEPYDLAEPIEGLPLVPIRARRPETMDKILCNSCSLALSCQYFREGGVCILGTSDTAALVRLFGTRDAEMVAQGLGDVLSIQAQRHGKLATAWDQTVEEIRAEPAARVIAKSKHLTELESSLIRGAEALIKVLTPDASIKSNVPAVNATQINVYNPATLVADVVRRLEEKGVARAAIEPAMILEAAQQQGLVPISDIPEESANVFRQTLVPTSTDPALASDSTPDSV